ncbi:MAG TPA: tetratricopeptide repeat protein [Polyangiaceae bacterium]|nr:tetratricopeptide repeat protein [Polyangiaceae bacterium]
MARPSSLKNRLLSALGLAALALSAASTVAPAALAQDFTPGHRKPGKPGKPAAPGPAKPGPAKPGPAKPGPAKPGAPTPAKPVGEPARPGAPSAVLIERYTRIVLGQPGSPFPLQRLAQLYRDKDGNIANLVKDFEARAAQAGADQYAATATLAGIYKLDGRGDEAVKTFERAIALRATDPSAILALARLLQDRGDTAAARARYEQGLALQTAAPEREQTIRTLMTLALDAKDLAAAKAAHLQLVQMQPTSLFVRGELGRELFTRGEFEKAEVELKELVAAAAGDNRALAPALKDLGRAQAKAHKNKEALATLKRALSAAGAEAAVRGEIYETITELYRADQQLPVLVKQLEDEHPNDFARLALLGSLYEETGDAQRALETYKRALAVNPRHIDLRLKVIRVLQSQGELDKAIAEYEGLIRAAPNNPTFVFEQCEALMQRGDRPRSLRLLTELEARAGTDEDVLNRLADFYGRIGEGERSMKVLQRLAQVSTGDPGHLVDLGDRYFQDGNQALAIQTWKRILAVIQPRAKALSALGDVYLEHDMTADALAAFKEATQLDAANVTYKKQLASAHERSKQYREAHAIWQEIAAKAAATNDKLLAREARTRLVSLWGFERQLEPSASCCASASRARRPIPRWGARWPRSSSTSASSPTPRRRSAACSSSRPATRTPTSPSSGCWCRRTRSPRPSPRSRSSWPWSPGAPASSTSAWPNTRCRSTATTTPSNTPRARSS